MAIITSKLLDLEQSIYNSIIPLDFKLSHYHMLDYDEKLEHIIYTGWRGTSSVGSGILRKRKAGRRVNIIMSGSFFINVQYVVMEEIL